MTFAMPDVLLYKHHPGRAINAESSSRAPQLSGPSKSRRKKHHDHGPSNLSRLVQSAGNVVLSWRDGLSSSEREAKRRREERMQILAARMEHAATLREWRTAAIELDQLEGNDEWKLDDFSVESEYHPDLIRAQLQALDTARINCDIDAMMYLIRTALSRDLGGTGNTELYRHSYIGTKALIERYVNSAVQTIEAVVNMPTCKTGLDTKELLEGMVYARQSFGRSALLLSGGATFGMSHIGVLKTLYEQRLLPRIMSGASAGSIVCAVACTRKDDEVPSLIKAFPFGDLGVFEGEAEGFSDHLLNLLTKGSWSDITNLTRVMRSWLGDVTFLEAYNRTRRICNICVSSASIYDVPRLLNYVTAPNVLIWSAVAASCAVPLIFQGHPLLMKHPITGAHEPWIPTPQQFIDGSVDNDLPMTRLAEMFNVNHFIVSQVNPHVVPFLPKDEQAVPGHLQRDMDSQRENEWLQHLASIAKEESLHRMKFLAELGVFPNLLTKLLSVMGQQYSGDINILPEITLSDIPLILKNPTPEFMLRNCLIGERATWPKVSRIRDRLAIELALDQAVHALRARVVFSKSQVDLRRAMGVSKPVGHYYYDSKKKSSSAAPTPSGHGVSPLGDSGYELSPTTTTTTSGPAVRVVQPPGSSGEVTPSSDEKATFGRRRGSGASIQLVAARHNKKPFHQEDGGGGDNNNNNNYEDQSDEDERLELKPRSSRTAAGSSSSSGKTGLRAGGGASLKPRLRRNAKSHGHIRSGKPLVAEFYRARDELRLSARELLKKGGGGGGGGLASVGNGNGNGNGNGTGTGEDTTATATSATATAEEGGAAAAYSLAPPDVLGPGYNVAPAQQQQLETESGSQASDGGLTSDADPYAWTFVNKAARAGSSSDRRLSPASKLRYSET
ncbi:patatin-domain-containing protein [Parathielavia hyrcaniae]|uniref:Patatin-domain-containing protein n=1 Tax=Parathielavia hyrcaniae TaxID=113614 RepID=A0AAN6T1A3_9PEZI|nr:patatin-domain-containing protein [Parathielavia hyrcaniae]